MTGRSENDWDGAWLGFVILLGVLVFVAYREAPQAFGFLIGALVGGMLVLVGIIDTADPRCRGWVARTIAAGALTVISYFVLDGLIGADVQMRRFRRTWEATGQDASVLLDYPWAVVPLGCAAALIGAGAVVAVHLLRAPRPR